MHQEKISCSISSLHDVFLPFMLVYWQYSSLYLSHQEPNHADSADLCSAHSYGFLFFSLSNICYLPTPMGKNEQPMKDFADLSARGEWKYPTDSLFVRFNSLPSHRHQFLLTQIMKSMIFSKWSNLKSQFFTVLI